MRTIAISIDATTEDLLDQLCASAGSGRSRSAVVRAAVRALAEQEKRRQQEEHERKVLRRHRRRLEQEARALVDEQRER